MQTGKFDLSFYPLKLRRYVAIELRDCDSEPGVII